MSKLTLATGCHLDQPHCQVLEYLTGMDPKADSAVVGSSPLVVTCQAINKPDLGMRAYGERAGCADVTSHKNIMLQHSMTFLHATVPIGNVNWILLNKPWCPADNSFNATTLMCDGLWFFTVGNWWSHHPVILSYMSFPFIQQPCDLPRNNKPPNSPNQDRSTCGCGMHQRFIPTALLVPR